MGLPSYQGGNSGVAVSSMLDSHGSVVVVDSTTLGKSCDENSTVEAHAPFYPVQSVRKQLDQTARAANV
jgi:hypothetical protein